MVLTPHKKSCDDDLIPRSIPLPYSICGFTNDNNDCKPKKKRKKFIESNDTRKLIKELRTFSTETSKKLPVKITMEILPCFKNSRN